MTKTWNEAAHDAANEITTDPAVEVEPILDYFDEDISALRRNGVVGSDLSVADRANRIYRYYAKCLAAHALHMLSDRTGQTRSELADQIAQIAARKHHDYGTGNISAFGVTGLVVRTSDKVERLKNLLARTDQPINESRDDTLTDIVGYAIVGMLWVDGNFELPLAGDVAAATSGSFDKILDATILSYGDLVLSGEPRMGKLIAAPERSPLLRVNDEFNALVQEWNRQLDEHAAKVAAVKKAMSAGNVQVWPLDFQRTQFRVDL